MLKIAILQDSKFVTIVIVVSSSNVDSTVLIINDDVSIPFLPQQVVGFKLIVIVKLIIVVFLVLIFFIQLMLLLILVLIFKTFFFIKAVLR